MLIYCLITSQWEAVFLPTEIITYVDGASTGRAAEIYAWSKTLSEQIIFPSSILNNVLFFN